MKTEDFDRLKELCDKYGFSIESYSGGKTAIIGVKDPWEGVEFYKNYKGYIQPINDNVRSNIKNGIKMLIKPSTEQAYIDQLKKEAFERFDGKLCSDKIDYSMMFGGKIQYSFNKDESWKYRKDTDTLYWAGIPIYQQGKWSKRVEEKLTGKYVRYHILWPNEDGANLGFSFSGFCDEDGMMPTEKMDKAGEFLAKQLENYLNNDH